MDNTKESISKNNELAREDENKLNSDNILSDDNLNNNQYHRKIAEMMQLHH